MSKFPSLIATFAVILFLSFACLAQAWAEDDAAAPAERSAVQGFRSTDRPLPRFASLKSDKIYVRAGPAMRYPIRWIYTRGGLPVEIIQEFDAWRKIRDFDGDEGWVHKSLLSGVRMGLVKGGAEEGLAPVHEKDAATSRMVARLEPQVLVSLDKCGGAWCRIETHGYKGWLERKFIWGIYEDEELN